MTKISKWLPDREQLGRDRRERLQGKGNLQVMVIFIILTAVVVSMVYMYVKTDQIVYFKCIPKICAVNCVIIIL